MKEVEVEAKSTREAIAIALKKLRVKRHEVEIRILNEETKGLFDEQGAKKAKVKVKVRGR